MKEIKAILRVVGSLWFATTLLLALMLAMGSATIFETTRGPEQTRALFYLSPWFKGLEWLLAINVLAALLMRLPFKKKLIPFYAAHLGIIITLLGALITEKYGLNGTLNIGEGTTENEILVNDDVFELAKLKTSPKAPETTKSELSIREHLGNGLKSVDLPQLAETSLDDVHLRVLRYWPDMKEELRFANDAKEKLTALQISIGKEEKIWVVAGRRQFAGGMHAAVIPYEDTDKWEERVKVLKAESLGPRLTATLEGATYEIPLKDATDETAPIGDTGFSIKIARYMPRARVREDGKVVNEPKNVMNPAAEVDLTKDGKTVRRLLFATHPDFVPKQSQPGFPEVKVRLRPGLPEGVTAPLEFHVSPAGEVTVLMLTDEPSAMIKPLAKDSPIETPWPEKTLTLHSVYDHARPYKEQILPDPIRKDRQPAAEVSVTTPDGTETFWIRKYSPRQFPRPNGLYQLTFRDHFMDLGFNVFLKDFEIGYYPGGDRPRTYQSSVVFTDPETGAQENVLIGMNKPGKYKGYTFYQSSFSLKTRPVTSVLSVAKDPGMLTVFLGYFMMMGGILALIVMGMLKAKKKGVAPKYNDKDKELAADA